MKRMVKNGDLIDVEPDGTITVGSKAINGVEANPTGEATQTLEKIKIGDVAYSVGGGGGGSDYTAGSNIEISNSKEIAVKSALTNVASIDFKQTDGVGITGLNKGIMKIKSKYTGYLYPVIRLSSAFETSDKGFIAISFNGNTDFAQYIYFDCYDYKGNTAYVFTTRGSKVPQVPTGDGTYVLKATVSGGTVTYSWVAE